MGASGKKRAGATEDSSPVTPAYLTSLFDVGGPADSGLRYLVSTGTFRDVLVGDFVSSTVSTPLS